MSSPANINEEMESIIIKEKTKTSTAMDSILPPSDRHALGGSASMDPKSNN